MYKRQDFTVKNEKTEGGATPSEAEKKYEALPYIASVQLSFEKQGMPEWNSPHTSISSSLLSAVKRGEAVTWKTEDILDSYSKYKYSLTFYDRFGNQLPVSKTSATGGETRTCLLYTSRGSFYCRGLYDGRSRRAGSN